MLLLFVFFYCLNCYSFDLSETSPFAHGRLKCPGHVVMWQENEIPHSGSFAEFLVLIFSCYYKALGSVAKLEETGADI